MERLRRMLEAERERAEKSWMAYRDALHELVDVKLKLDAIRDVLAGDSA